MAEGIADGVNGVNNNAGNDYVLVLDSNGASPRPIESGLQVVPTAGI